MKSHLTNAHDPWGAIHTGRDDDVEAARRPRRRADERERLVDRRAGDGGGDDGASRRTDERARKGARGDEDCCDVSDASMRHRAARRMRQRV